LGKARLQAGRLETKDARLDSADARFQVSGTMSLKRELDLKLVRAANGVPGAGYAITGTLTEPLVVRSAGPETQAQLKAEPTK
jgi:autotransporter translocation and assembly factor TamB